MRFKKSVSALVAAVLLLTLSAPMALADQDGSVLRIASLQNWKEFTQMARLDSWSDNLTVVLETDLDLTYYDSVPTFGGTFEGNGHSIHLSIDGEGDNQGLFRYLREGGLIQNLTITGTVAPAGHSINVGGVVGCNSGTVRNCQSRASITGNDSVGSIVGFNDVTGRIEKCETTGGVVSGEHYTGGIVGNNMGAVVGCVNRSKVNPYEVMPSTDPDQLDWSRLNRVENFPACTDTGGIAGYSGGLLQDCANEGLIGYPHVGYNAGGVAGRQAGQLIHCTNSGAVRGRKDVGGIVGQAEPFTELKYQEDVLKKLSRELDRLTSLMNQTVDSVDSTRLSLSDHLTTVNDHTGNAQDHVSNMLDEIEAVGDETVDVANDLSGRVHDFMEDLEDVTGDLEDAGGDISDGLDTLGSASGSAGDAEEKLHRAIQEMKAGLKQLKQALEELDQVAHDTSDAPIPDEDDDWFSKTQLGYYEDLAGHVVTVAGNVNKDVIPQLTGALSTLHQALDMAMEANPTLQAAFRKIEKAMGQLSDGTDHLTDAAGGLKDALKEQNDLPTLELPKLSPEFHDTEQALRDTMTAINEELEAMNQTANNGGDALSGHLKGINSQFNAITDVLRHAGDDFDDPDLVVDITNEDLSKISGGRIQNCANSGQVEGDVGIGGVVGGMSIELDFDPEDDVRENGDKSMKFQYRTRALVLSCVNRGEVNARKNGSGGIVGNMDLGLVLSCQNYGNVKSTNGEQVGGIAGRSDSVIRDSWAKCTLSGSRKVGGIVGSGTDIVGCKSLVQIEDGLSCQGAIAGEADGIVQLNWFISQELGGVDGISYAGKAAPATWDDFQTLPGLPEEFKSIRVEFFVDHEKIKTLTVPYGAAIPEEDLPKIPDRPCCYGSWDNFDPSCVVADQQVNAVYEPWLTAVSGEDGAVLAEGSFQPDTELASKCLDPMPTIEGQDVRSGYSVHLMGTDRNFDALRIRLPEDVKHGAVLAQQTDGSWVELPATREGSYLRVELEGSEAILAVVADGSYMWLMIGVAALVVVLAVTLVVHKKRQSAASGEDQTTDAEQQEQNPQ